MPLGTAPRVFFGWWTVLSAGIINFRACGYVVYGISAFFKPIASEIGLSRAETSAASSIASFGGGFEGPLAGWGCDRFGPRRVVLFGLTFLVLGLLLMNYIDSFAAFIVVWGIIVSGGGNVTYGVPS